MPNHIQNRLTLKGSKEDVAKVFSSMESEPTAETKEISAMDFEKIVPMPAHVYRGDLSTEDEKRYGKENCWYDWSCKNWGTKWNCYQVNKVDDNTIEFQTAWSMPAPIIVALSNNFKTVEFTIEWADEDTGNNCGSITMKSGRAVSKHIPVGGSKEAYDFAFKLRPDCREYYRLDRKKGNYVSKE